MGKINDKYQNIIKGCKFISKPHEWFVEGTEAKLEKGSSSFRDYSNGDKFNDGWSLFNGLTNETFVGYEGKLPRQDGETCPFEEFFIYDKYGNEISELTLEEYELMITRKLLLEKDKNKDDK